MYQQQRHPEQRYMLSEAHLLIACVSILEVGEGVVRSALQHQGVCPGVGHHGHLVGSCRQRPRALSVAAVEAQARQHDEHC